MNQSPESLMEARKADGAIDTRVLAEILQVSEAELQASIGAFDGTDAQAADGESGVLQVRMDVLLRILEQVSPWAGSPQAAYDWYCSEAIASLGGRTARDLVEVGRADAVENYLQRIAHGGYA